MSGHEREGERLQAKLSGDVRLVEDQFLIPMLVFRDEVRVSAEQLVLSVDDASLLEAQMTRLLCVRAGLTPEPRKGSLGPWRPY